MSSLKASSTGIKEAQVALIEKFSTQQRLADSLVITRQPVNKFFNGKNVDSAIFVRICEKLGLEWRNIAMDLEIKEQLDLQQEIDTEALILEVRSKIKPKIQEQCGLMRVLDMTHPIGLCDIYTDVNMLETVTGRQRIGIEDLLKNFNPDLDNFDRRGLAKVTEKRLAGPDVVNHHPKLMVLGKPGAGKSTFLKYLAIQCIWEKFQDSRIPIFITLKEFAETKNSPDLLEFISQTLSVYGVKSFQIEHLISHGRLLFLLDGLDEVREEDINRIIKQIELFSGKFFFSKDFVVDQPSFLDERNKKFDEIEIIKIQKIDGLKKIKRSDFPTKHQKMHEEIIEDFEREKRDVSQRYPDLSRHSDQGLEFLSKKFPHKIYSNHFVITCRIAAREYIFQNFSEVEVADFDDRQIQSFVRNWFELRNPSKGKKFLKKLSDNLPLRELANSPLLLTLLCLVFEESTDFPINRSELYKEGVSILLKKWDGQRNIERDQAYKNLSVPRKEDLLSSVAFYTFDRKNYFFKQQEIESYIVQYIRNLPDAKTDPKALQLDSEVVLKSIEAQHGLLVERARGIYSFSHLTFQEYFAARKIITTSEPQRLEEALCSLSNHINEKRWREVLLLALGMLPNAERLLKLLKQQVDSIVASDPELCELLLWAQEKSLPYTLYRPEAIRYIYFIIGCDLTRDLPKTRLKPLSSEADFDRALELLQLLDKQLVEDISCQNPITYSIIRDFIITRDLARDLAIDLAKNLTTIPGLKEKNVLKSALDGLPDFTESKTFIKDWWQNNGEEWIENFKALVIKQYNIGNNCHYSLQQRSTLKQYYNANKMLLECLNSDCYVRIELRQEIRDSLFSLVQNRTPPF